MALLSLLLNNKNGGFHILPTIILYSFSFVSDRNSSHQVDWGDFYLVVRKIKDVYGADSMQTKFAKKTLAALWEDLCTLADLDEDQLISIDEWIKLLNDENLTKNENWLHKYEQFMFQLFDVSCNYIFDKLEVICNLNVLGDGVIDIDEYVDGMLVYGLDRDASRKAFQKFSVDDDGVYVPVITPTIWSTYFHELFHSIDRNALGNHLFGIIDF
ncbi:hypothetical protein DICVIV_01785 [Dictyocaulus viviparus]|uniref:EF hand n=1 Tax=Dictyocaulus viviparus TaxID=29172 RepID=A0A0D8Y5C9_DICVI|nr:hypothetical protein DICVIV_01785 [Dictyocaulus viviparus]